MITKNNLKNLLNILEFEQEGNTYQKTFGDSSLMVDFDKKELIYPEEQGLIVNERQTCNFSQNENFVVFECVHRLLDKGYKPQHLELERPYRIGRGTSGGRADILVKDYKNNPLLIIECKTAGEEFEKAWDETRQDGGQLFSYVHQEAETKYLCLYTSSFTNNELDYKYKLIPHLDNPLTLEEDSNLLSFEKASKAEQRFAVWRDTYKLESTEVGIFEKSIQPYQIGKSLYTLAEDTKPIDVDDKKGKYDRFRDILRQHSIARRETAFEVLVNLFLCKLVDEEENINDLKFYWNGPLYDNYFDFVDRLQSLYHRGMRKYLNEEITYISREQIEGAFWPVRNDKNATKQLIHEYFTELKFFSNSAFSFLDTHNKDLFDRNTAVLSEVVQMWQGLRLKTDEPNQFLGDMFEHFLDNGIKQSEGQFFTPLPICKFIVGALPLAHKIDENPEPLKVIDYACGSGHFLNEYAYQIKQINEKDETKRDIDLNDYYANITGIEKEDRLARVAKVAAYMHGQGDIKILDADALASHPNDVRRESFDVLVANPPFSVVGFLKTLNDVDQEMYQLIEKTGKNSKTPYIECFFLERIYHLMAPGGVVGVIVPDGILSDPDAVHTHTREILLKYFDIVSIVELGRVTFSQTRTITVVLFLSRKLKREEERPEPADQYYNRVQTLFEGDEEEEYYQDHSIIQAYCSHIEIPYAEYIKLFNQTSLTPLTQLLEYDIFNDYKQAFRQSTEIKDLKNSNTFKKKTPIEQSTELEQRFIKYIHNIERDKLYYFMLAHEQKNKVLIVNAPSADKEQKEYLGYKWSGRKGNEGIQYNGGDTVNDIITPLFDPNKLNNNEKINSAIKSNFIGEISDQLPEHCRYANLTDMLEFSRIDFDKNLNLTPKLYINITNQLPFVRLGDEIDTIETGKRPKGGVGNLTSGAWSLGGEHIHPTTGRVDLSTPKYVPLDFYHGSTRGILKENDILICKDGALTGKIALLREELKNEHAMVNEHVYILRCESELKQYYIFNFLFSDNGQKLLKQNITGSAQRGLNSTNLKEIKIPLPQPEKQQQIVDECNAVDQETDTAHQTITTANQEIEEKVQSVINAGHGMKNIDRVLNLEYGISLPEKNRINGEYPVFGSNGIVGNHNAYSVNAPCIIVGRKGSAGEINWSEKNCTPIDTTFYVELLDETTDLKFIFYMLKSLNLPSLKGGSGPGGINRNKIYALQIPVPPLNIQQQLVAEVEQLEAQITEAQAIIDNATERKNAILTQHL